MSDNGFELINDPGKILGRFGESAATYLSNANLCFVASFSPGDCNDARLLFGRKWTGADRWRQYSNSYPATAKHFGLDVPNHYVLGYGDEVPLTIQIILDDIVRTLSTVLKRCSLQSFSTVENEEFGAKWVTELQFGLDFLNKVEIRSYD